MNFACPTMDIRNPFANYIGHGVSEDASFLRKLSDSFREDLSRAVTTKSLLGQLSHVLWKTKEDSLEDNWDGYGALPVSFESYLNARQILDTMPTTTPLPDISADPDGEISFEWYNGARKRFSLSVGADGQLTYAGIFGSSKAKGIESFGDEIPKTILESIKRVFA